MAKSADRGRAAGRRVRRLTAGAAPASTGVPAQASPPALDPDPAAASARPGPDGSREGASTNGSPTGRAGIAAGDLGASTALTADDLPDGLVVVDAAGRVVTLNRAAERVLGRMAADVLGRDVREALPLQDTDGRNWWACTDPWGGLATRTGH